MALIFFDQKTIINFINDLFIFVENTIKTSKILMNKKKNPLCSIVEEAALRRRPAWYSMAGFLFIFV